jgi:hypothetical protein
MARDPVFEFVGRGARELSYNKYDHRFQPPRGGLPGRSHRFASRTFLALAMRKLY